MNMPSPASHKCEKANIATPESQKSASSRNSALFCGNVESVARSKISHEDIDLQDGAHFHEVVVSASRSPSKSVGAMSPWGNRPVSALSSHSVHSARSITPDLCERRMTPSPRKALFVDADLLVDIGRETVAEEVVTPGSISFCDRGVQ